MATNANPTFKNNDHAFDIALAAADAADWQLCRQALEFFLKDAPVSNWIRGGLQYVEKSDQRYFFEQDVIDYLWNRSQTQ